MQKLSEKHGQDITEGALRFHSIRLKSRPQTKDFADTIDTERKTLQTKHELWKEAREQRVAHTAEITYLDETLGQIVGQVSTSTLLLAGNNRKALVYTKLFPVTPTQMLEGYGEEQDTHINTLQLRLEEDPDYNTLQSFVPQIKTALEALHLAIEARKSAYVDESKSWTDYMIARDKAQRAYNLMYPRLQLTFPDDALLVESFFAKLSSPSPEQPPPTQTPT